MTGEEPNGLRRVRLPLASAVLMIFILMSSGAFGLEDMVSSAGPGMALLLLLLLPVVWALPISLVCCELGSMMPEAGGYYVWVRRSLGSFWGFQQGWSSWLCLFVDNAVYIALTVGYVRGWFGLNGFEGWLVGLGLITLFSYINIRGLKLVALQSVVFSIVILAPFAALVALGFGHWHHAPFSPFLAPGQSTVGGLGLALVVGIWMYTGMADLSPMAGEVHEAQRVIPKAIMIGLPIVVLSYILPTLAGLAGVGRWADWSTGSGFSFVQIARQLGGPVLGVAMLASAVVGNVPMYVDYLASGSRVSYAMADDRLLPRWLNRTHPKHGTPYVSILFLAAVNAVLIIGTFAQLVVIDVFLDMFGYTLIMLAVIRLRQKQPGMKRPFRVRGGVPLLVVMAVPVFVLAVAAMFTNGLAYMIGGPLALATGPLAYFVFKRRYGGPAKSDAGAVPEQP